MERTKEAELIGAVLTYAVRCLAEGDQAALHSLNFGTREAAALRDFTLTDLQRFGAVHGHCLDIRLNRESYWLIVEHLRRERETEALQSALILADAPFEMMRAFFGLDSRTYARLRSLAGVRPVVGRPPTPDESIAQRLWEAWKVHGIGGRSPAPTRRRLLVLAPGDRHPAARHLAADPPMVSEWGPEGGRVRRTSSRPLTPGARAPWRGPNRCLESKRARVGARATGSGQVTRVTG